MPFALDFFAEATSADLTEAWLTPDFVTTGGQYLMAFQAFVIEAGTHPRRHWYRQLEESPTDPRVRPSTPTLPRKARRSRIPHRNNRSRRLHPPARRPRRLEHPPCRLCLDTYLPQRALPLRRTRRWLLRPLRRSVARVRVRRLGCADHRCWARRPCRQRCIRRRRLRSRAGRNHASRAAGSGSGYGCTRTRLPLRGQRRRPHRFDQRRSPLRTATLIPRSALIRRNEFARPARPLGR